VPDVRQDILLECNQTPIIDSNTGAQPSTKSEVAALGVEGLNKSAIAR
jgi:hypothetical protein